jgi:hypothetical protein
MDAVDEELAQVGAVLVEERVLRRIIKSHRRIPGIGLQVPHEHCYTLARNDLERRLERGDIAVALAKLPERVILIAGDREALAGGSQPAWSQAWRLIFHARVHQAFEQLLVYKQLTSGVIRERINRIGQTEFDEIRSVLRQEELLLPPVDDITIYIEFVALYLELRHFAPRSIERTFTLLDTAEVGATIGLDLDAAALLAAARPVRAPAQPIVDEPSGHFRSPTGPIEAVVEPSARKRAIRARDRGNRSRAAILAARSGDVHGARGDLDELVARLARALGKPPTQGWSEALVPVARSAAGRRVLRFVPGARLLHDLQSACVVAEREVRVVDPMTWALSRGRRPIVRKLPATREVRIAKHLHAAAAKIPTVELETGEERDRLTAVLHAMTARADANVRDALRPELAAALEEVGLHPHSLPERVAEKKLIDELLDHAVAVGRLSIGNLRDALSHNDLKMTDLQLGELTGGDQLLRCDRLLSEKLDGVYRRGEVYLRYLQKISSILFGTRLGRFLSLYLMLPLLGSFTVLEGLQHMVGPISHWLFHVHPEIATRQTLTAGTVFLFLMLHLRLFRRGVVLLLEALWRIVRFVLWDVPRAIWRFTLVRRLLDSRIWRWLFKPALPAAIAWFVAADSPLQWPLAGATFVLFVVFLNSRFGRLTEELVTDWVVRSGRHFTSRILPQLVKWILGIFVELVELFDRGIYRVDEWLRFKSGESIIMLFVKGVIGTVWFVVTYFLRLYINLFIEPVVNPIKHFPVVTVAAKILLPISPAMLDALSGPAVRLMGSALGNSFAAFTVFIVPGLAGFLVWEFKENWKLYRATRPKTLRPIQIGHHGETMLGFLKPGFHSGTVPKLFTKLRRAAWKGDERHVAKHKEGLHHVGEAVERFAERELCALLVETAPFRVRDLAVSHVEIKSNRIEIQLRAPALSGDPAVIRFEQQSGWLVASVATPAWIDRLDDGQREIFEIALAGFYALAGVEIVREQVEHALRGDGDRTPAYDIADEGMLVWPGHGYDTEVVYDLRSGSLSPSVRGEAYDGLPSLSGRRAIFGREPVHWSTWSSAWQHVARGDAPLPVVVGPSLLRARAT